jgi:5-methylcytosine-specific restriction endonuclease McrA
MMTNPETTKCLSESLDTYIQEYNQLKLDSNHISIAIAEAEQRIGQILHEFLDHLPISDAECLCNRIYWTDRKFATTVKTAYNKVFRRGFQPNAKFCLVTRCKKCKRELRTNLSSWTAYDIAQKSIESNRGRPIYGLASHKTECEECKEKENKERNDRNEEYELNRERRLQYLKDLPYQEYLKTDHWQEKRKQVLREAGYKCQLCNSKEILDVHHRTYERIGIEWLSDLIALCRTCHEKHHDIHYTDDGDLS